MGIELRANWQGDRAPVVLSLNVLGLYVDAIQLVRIQVVKIVVVLEFRFQDV